MNSTQACGAASLSEAPVAIDREAYLSLLVRALSNTLEETVGAREASGFINLVGLAVAEEIQGAYQRATGRNSFDRKALTAVLLDLEHRIGGDFHIVEDNEDRIVIGNRHCPFGDLAKRCPSMCMMTSHVFGHMVAESQGYGRVTLADTIARGAPGCRIVIDLDPDAPGEGGQAYYARSDA